MHQHAIARIINGAQSRMDTVLAASTTRDDRTPKRRLGGNCGDLVMPGRIYRQPSAINESGEGLKGTRQNRTTIK